MRLSRSSLAVNLEIAGTPFSPLSVQRMQEARIQRTEFPLVKRYLAYETDGVLKEAAAVLQDAGIEVWSCHPPFGGEWDISQTDPAKRRRAVELTAGTFAPARALGATRIILHPSAEPIADGDRPARLAQARQSLRELAAVAPPGLRLAVEFLPRTCLGHTLAELMTIISNLDPERAGACLDVNHANLREDLACCVRTLGDRLLTLHISDNDGVDERHWLPGSGVIHWPAFLRALEQSSYAGAFVYETARRDGQELEGLKEIVRNFTTLLAQVHNP